MQHVTFTASGTYNVPVMRPETIEALRATIEQHLKAYGLKGIEIFANVATGAERP